MVSSPPSDRRRDPSRPADHIDAGPASDEGRPGDPDETSGSPRLGVAGWMRFFWRQLTSMRTALFLLLLLAVAAVPGSLVPQRSSDPNGVTQYFDEHPDLAPVIDALQGFDVYTSAWFSSIYLLLFLSLIGCVIPRTRHHLDALRASPPATPVRLARLPEYHSVDLPPAQAAALPGSGAPAQRAAEAGESVLRGLRYRVSRYARPGSRGGPEEPSASAERGYTRETGNLIFHVAMLGVLLAVGILGGFGYNGQRVVVEGQAWVNTLGDYDSFNPGRFFDESQLTPYLLALDELDVVYERENRDALGQPLDFTAHVTVQSASGEVNDGIIKVNEPLTLGGTSIYLLGNGYAPTLTVRDPGGEVVFTDSVPFLPQDANLTSLGVIKIPDGLAEQVGMIGFFYPTQGAQQPPYFSAYPDLEFPVLTLNVFTGDLGIDGGTPRSVYSLDTDAMTPVAGSTSGVDAVELMPGETVELPGGLGTVTFENAAGGGTGYAGSVPRFASFDIHSDPTQLWVLGSVVLMIAGLLLSLFVPRRRLWVKAVPLPDGGLRLEYAGLARGEDPGLAQAVRDLAGRHADALGTTPPPAAEASSRPV